MFRYAVLLLLLLTLAPCLAEPVPDILLLRRAEVMARTPDRSGHGVRVWTIRRDDKSRTALVELSGDLSLHKHPDARHSILLLEGEMYFRAGDSKEEILLKPGDYVSIQAGVPHKYRIPKGTALLMSFDAPAYDPSKTVRIKE